MFYYVYVLCNEANERYIGFTSDLKKRLASHNGGLNVSTKGHVWRVIYFEAYLSESDARKRELSLKKSGKGRALLFARISKCMDSAECGVK